VTNISQLVNFTTNATSSTNFYFSPTLATNYSLQARALFLMNFPWIGAIKIVSAVTNPPTIVVATPIITGSQVQLNFTVSGGPVATFRLPQTSTNWAKRGAPMAALCW